MTCEVVKEEEPTVRPVQGRKMYELSSRKSNTNLIKFLENTP